MEAFLNQQYDSTIDKANSIISKALKIGRNKISELLNPDGYFSATEIYLVCVLERFVANLNAVSILLPELKSGDEVETSVGLVLRASLLDFITLCYLNTFSNNFSFSNNNEIERLIEQINCDQLSHIIKELVRLDQHGRMTKEKIAQYRKRLYENFRPFFIKDDLMLITKVKPPSVYDMSKKIHNDTRFKEFMGAYDLWLTYSKYEHHGLLTYLFQRVNDGREYYLRNILISCHFCLYGQTICMANLDLKNANLNKMKDIAIEMALLSKEFEEKN